MVGLEPLAREDLAALHEFRRGEPHRHAVGRPSEPSASSLGLVVRVGPVDFVRLVVGAFVVIGVRLDVASSRRASNSGATDGNASASASARSPKTSVGS